MPPRIRPAAERDLDALYAIALATADAGADASRLYTDPKLIGHVHMAPYVVLQPDWCFVAEDENGVAGYVVGTPDTLGILPKGWRRNGGPRCGVAIPIRGRLRTQPRMKCANIRSTIRACRRQRSRPASPAICT